jgi:hypothetical protein
VVREALLRILRRDVSKSWRGAAAAELDALIERGDTPEEIKKQARWIRSEIPKR